MIIFCPMVTYSILATLVTFFSMLYMIYKVNQSCRRLFLRLCSSCLNLIMVSSLLLFSAINDYTYSSIASLSYHRAMYSSFMDSCSVFINGLMKDSSVYDVFVFLFELRPVWAYWLGFICYMPRMPGDTGITILLFYGLSTVCSTRSTSSSGIWQMLLNLIFIFIFTIHSSFSCSHSLPYSLYGMSRGFSLTPVGSDILSVLISAVVSSTFSVIPSPILSLIPSDLSFSFASFSRCF